MNEKMTNPVPQYSYGSTPEPEDINSPVMVRRRIKKGYSWAGSAIIWQQGIVLVIALILGIVVSITSIPKIMAENPDISSAELSAQITQATTGIATVTANAVIMTFANILTIIIISAATKAFSIKSLLKKPSGLPASAIALGALACMGVQMISLLIQNAVMSLTGYTGVNESTANALSFSDDTFSNIVLIIYLVICAPVFEELLFRGMVLNLCSPVSRGFAIWVAAILFGLMHGNFNQMFNAVLLGLCFGYIAVKSGSVLASIICHMAANANALILSLVFENYLANAIGEEKAGTFKIIAMLAELVLGMVALVILLKKNGKIQKTDMIAKEYTYELEEADSKKLKWSAMLKTPTFWISAAICIITGISMLTPVAQEMTK